MKEPLCQKLKPHISFSKLLQGQSLEYYQFEIICTKFGPKSEYCDPQGSIIIATERVSIGFY